VHAHHESAAKADESRLRLVLLLTAGFMVVEVTAAFVSNSLSLLADAGHMVADSGGLALALLAIHFGGRPASAEKSYGYYRLEMLAALTNGAVLLAIAAYIFFESYQRLMDPAAIEGAPMLAVAVAGLTVNLVSAALLHSGQKTSLNMRGAYLEVLSDLAGSVAVIAAATVYLTTGFERADPIASLFIALFILPRTWSLISETVHVLLEGSPRNVDLDAIRSHILDTGGVTGFHDLHVWNLTSGMSVMSVHVAVREGISQQAVLEELCSCLADHFDIEHCTIQIEQPDRQAMEHASH
jgi:cobalt-zinc-cadmium efflux system protein